MKKWGRIARARDDVTGLVFGFDVDNFLMIVLILRSTFLRTTF